MWIGRHEERLHSGKELLVRHSKLELVTEVSGGPHSPYHDVHSQLTGNVDCQPPEGEDLDVLLIPEVVLNEPDALLSGEEALLCHVVGHDHVESVIEPCTALYDVYVSQRRWIKRSRKHCALHALCSSTYAFMRSYFS